MVDTPGGWDDLWGIVGESLLGGVHHALNNRVAALSAIAQVLRAGMNDAAPLVRSLSDEVSRLEGTVAMLTMLRRATSRRPEPVQLPELVATLTPILEQHNDLKETVFVTGEDPGVLPVLAERDLLTRVLLTLMVSAGLEAESTRSRRVLVSYRGDEAVVTVRVCRDETEGGVEREEDDDILRLDASAAGEAALAMDGELTVTRDQVDGTCYDLRLPTLIEARRASGGR